MLAIIEKDRTVNINTHENKIQINESRYYTILRKKSFYMTWDYDPIINRNKTSLFT